MDTKEPLVLSDGENARMLTPEPWKHKRKSISHGKECMDTYECSKCGFAFIPGTDGGYWEEGLDCPVPDPIAKEGDG